MSQENVDLVREGFDAFARGDIDALLAGLDPEIKWDLSRRQLEPAVYRGHQGVRELFSSLREVWSEQHFEAEECLDAGDSVVVTIRFVSTGRGSSLSVTAEAWYVYELRDGLAVRATMYQTKAEALEAAGLSE